MQVKPGPTTVAIASLLCLVVGLLYLAMQVRTVFSNQLKQEYASLVLEAAARAQGARDEVAVWQRVPGNDPANAQGHRHARAELAQRLASLAALVNASPSPTPNIALAASPADLSLDDTDALLRSVSTYWHMQRDAASADVRERITHIARALIALGALLFVMLITAVAMYVKRNRQLAGQSHEFEHASLHDWMTGLPNRRKLLATLQAAADEARASSGSTARKLALLYVDLDGFKQVNDLFGHRAGDEFLISVSTRFRETVRKTDVVARIGGDEFAVLVRAFAGEAELVDIAQRLIACVVRTDEESAIGLVRASVGIACFPDPVGDYRRLVAAADDAMYQVKRSGKNGYAFAKPGGRAAVS